MIVDFISPKLYGRNKSKNRKLLRFFRLHWMNICKKTDSNIYHSFALIEILAVTVIFLLSPFLLKATEPSDLGEKLFPEGDFNSLALKEMAKWYSNGVKILPGKGMDNTAALYLPRGKKSGCVLKNIPVEPLTRYRLIFYAKIDEDNFRFRDYAFRDQLWKSAKYILPEWRISFYASNSLEKPLSRGHWTFYQKIISNKWALYKEEFYTPEKSAFMGISFSNSKNGFAVLIDDIQLEKLDSEKIVNINPDFSFGKYNYSGYNHTVKGWIREQPGAPGKYYIDLSGGGYVIGDFIPVKGGKKYRITVIGKAKEAGSWARLDLNYNTFQPMEKKPLFAPVWFRFTNIDALKEESYDFVMPEWVDYVNLAFSNGVFEKVELKEIAE